MIVHQTDITVSGDNGVIAIIEVKNSEELDLPLATELMGGGSLGTWQIGSQFALLVSQDKGFLWDLRDARRLDEAKVWELPMGRYLAPYLRRAAGKRLRHEELTWLVFTWLGDLANVAAPNKAVDGDSPLAASGLLGKLREGAATVSMTTL